MRKLLLFLTAGLLLAATPVLAAITITPKAVSTSNTSNHSLASGSFSANAGDIIVAHGAVRLAASGDVTGLTDSVDGAFTAGNVTECRISAGANGGYVGWLKVTTGGSRTVTVADGAAATATGLNINIVVLSGTDSTTPEDTAVRGTCASNNGNAANPIGTTGSAGRAGEVMIGAYSTPTTAGFAPTGDAAWTYSTGWCSGSAVEDWCNASITKAGTGTQTMQLTVTARLYSYTFMGFQPPAVVGTSFPCVIGSGVMGC